MSSAENKSVSRPSKPINHATDNFYQVNISDETTKDLKLSKNESAAFDICRELIEGAGGEIREDMGDILKMIIFTLPEGVENPIKEDDGRFSGLSVYTRFWHKLGFNHTNTGEDDDATDGEWA
ncbi:hypothetical protein MMC15_004977 [Xylographa vitiligo]|nr:hypothetical protein [Xylographa vitiligo]